jgi:hypothetical protein
MCFIDYNCSLITLEVVFAAETVKIGPQDTRMFAVVHKGKF